MKCFLVLSATTSQTEIFFDVIDITFNGSSDFVSIIPFFCSTKCAWIGTKVFFWINVNHSSTSGCGTWIITMADSYIFSSSWTLFIFDFGTYEFVTYKTIFTFRGAFRFHGKGFVMWTAGNAICI